MRFIFPLLLSIALSPLSWSGDLEDGLVAYDRQDYSTALEKWKPLAEQGEARAQHNLALMSWVSVIQQ